MAAASSNRVMPIFWFVALVLLIPFGLAYLLFDSYQFQVGVVLALICLFAWFVIQGTGWQRAEKGTVVLRRGPGDELRAFWRKPPLPKGQGAPQPQARAADSSLYFFAPGFHTIEAILPSYGFGFEVMVEKIDTQTPWLSQIIKLRVRAGCRLLPERYLDFYARSHGWLDRIKHYEEQEKLSRTSILLWKKLLGEITEDLVDNAVRDVVWRWSARLSDPDFAQQLSYIPPAPKEPDASPYSLSRNRLQLEREVTNAIRSKAAALGIEISPIVFELIEIDPELIKKINRNKDNELAEANHKALQEAELIRQRGYAEAEVRARNLALLLDELLNKRDMTLKDALVTDIVRAALYTDGQMIWSAMIDKGKDPGPAKTA
jgi:hypothetical protein